MKFRFLLLFVLLTAGACLLFVGCNKDNEDPFSDSVALSQMMSDDQDIDGVNSWTSDEEQNSGGSLDEAITPLRWGRIGRMSEYHYSVEIQGDTLATITRTARFNGNFRVVTDTTDSNRTVYNKPMFNQLVRKAHAIRIARTDRPRQNWRIYEITPEVMRSVEPNPNTAWPTRVQFLCYRMGGLTLLADITHPLETYLARDTLPIVSAGGTLIVRVTVNRPGVAAFVHPHAMRFGPNPRLRLHDDGVAPDEVAGDGIFSGSYTVSTVEGVRHAAVDLMDSGTLLDSELPYNSAGWSLPYRVLNIID